MRTADLSVVMANRNHARYLPRALDAVLSQSLLPREVIVLDDDSTDDSVKILEDYAKRFSCIRLIRNERQRGVTACYNHGFSLATGKYILPGAADDYILPGFIQKAMAQFAQNPHAGLCTAFGSCTVGDDGPLVANDPGWCTEPTCFSPDELCRLVRHSLPVSAIIARRDALLAAGGYRDELAWYSDWFAFLVIAFRHGAIHLPETLGINVQRPHSYATNAGAGEANRAILGSLLGLLMSDEYADVAAYFRRNGVACHLGRELFLAAAEREDQCNSRLLGLLSGFTPADYEEFAQHPTQAVRKLAAIFLQEPLREVIARRGDIEIENQRLTEEIQLTRLRAAPPGALGKLRWAARLLHRRMRSAAGLHPAGRFQ